MVFFRAAMFILLGGAALCFALYLATGRMHFRRWGVASFKWTVIAGLAFFAVLIFEELTA